MLIDIESVNYQSPYYVSFADEEHSLKFTTTHDIEYKVSFICDTSIFDGLPVYHLMFAAANRHPQDKLFPDSNIKETIFSIVGNFLHINSTAILYICEDKDERQRCRQRLFSMWFKQATAKKDKQYAIHMTSYNIDEENIMYVGMIANTNNPNLSLYVDKFDSLKQSLQEK